MTPRNRLCRGCRKTDRANGAGRAAPRVLLLQHAEWEVPGVYGDLIDAAGWPVVACRPDLGAALPDWTGFDAILAMGGPMSVNDQRALPWLRDELGLVARAVGAGVPFFGVCLGAQILAGALGARVYPGPRPEFGMGRVRMTGQSFDDPLFGGVPREPAVFQWHGDTFDLPDGAVPLATGTDVPNQALRVGEAAYGVQFHMEVSADLLDSWLALEHCRAEAVRALGPGGPAAMAAELRAGQARMLRLAERVFTGWMRLVDGRPRRPCPCARLLASAR